MGGSSSTTSQQSQTQPWAAAQPTLNGILGQLNSGLGNTGLNSTQTGAIQGIVNNANNTPNYAPAINSYETNLLGGGGATAQSGNISNAYNTYNAQTSPLASNTDYNPLNTPGLSQSLGYLQNQIATGINGQFAAAGRDMSPANTQALAYGETSGLAPLLTQQYNQNVQNQQGAAQNLYSAGNTTAGLQTGLTQQSLANQGTGLSSIPSASSAINNPYQNTLAAEQYAQQQPWQNLGLLANIGVPIAGLGSQSSGTSNTQNQAAPYQIIGGLGSALGSTNPATGAGSGILGLLGML